MATGNNTYQTIDQCVNSALMDINEDQSRYEQFLHWALEAAKDWHMDQAKEVKTVELTMSETKTVDLPSDFVDWVKVGIKCGNVIKTFVHDEKLTFHHECIDGKVVPNEECSDVNLWDFDTSNIEYPFWNFNGTNYPIMGLAYQSNGLGYFRYHRECNELQFRTVVPANAKIILEYISDGWDPTRKTLIHPYAAKLIKLYIHWMRLKYNTNVPRALAQEAKQEYWDEFDRVQYRMFDLTIEDILEVSRQSFHMGVKS
jgi:hypothetical protein